MNKFILTIVSFSILVACQQNSGKWPEDLEGKQALMKTKKTELRSLEADIKKLDAEIEELKPQREKKRRLVTTEQIKKREFQKFFSAQGNIVSDDVVRVSSDVGGRLLGVYVKEGDYVRRGKLIAKVDLESIDKQKAELETSLQLATTVYERQKRLWDQNIGSEIQYLEAKSNKERLEKSLETLSYQASRSDVYAPISGIVDAEYLKGGEIAAPGMPIVQILNTAKVKVVADLPEIYLGKVKRGDYVDLFIPVLDENLKAKVSLVGRSIDPANRTFKTEVQLNNRDGKLKPNLLIEMRVNDYKEKEAIVLPIELVQDEIGGKKFVYVRETGIEGEMAVKKYVQIGESAGSEILITEGLVGNEDIIVEGARNLTDKELIIIENKTAK